MDQKAKEEIQYREFKTLQLQAPKYKRKKAKKVKRFVLWPFAVIIPMFMLSVVLRSLTPSPSKAQANETEQPKEKADEKAAEIQAKERAVQNTIQEIFQHMPHTPPMSIQDTIIGTPLQFKEDMNAMIAFTSPELLLLVDKEHSLSADAIPSDIMSLDVYKESLLLNRNNLKLREIAISPLITMSNAAKKDGVSLLISSTYRSYSYQKQVFERIANELGEAQASRESARPGTSQHQLGTAVDFGSITPAFANTPAGKWLAENGLLYGFSMSYPPEGEERTGYIYESWHFRYIGLSAAVILEAYFEGEQQYMFEFIHNIPKEGI